MRAAAAILVGCALAQAAPIDREALVRRHHVILTNANPRTPLQVGNGEFAFGVDCTGLQTFLPAHTMSHWGWHSFPPPVGRRPEDLKLEPYETHGRPVGYATSQKGQEDLFRWLRENPHRLNLGRLSLRLTFPDGRPAHVDDLRELRQELDLWHGVIVSRFVFDGQPVSVQTACHPRQDIVAIRIRSPLVAAGRLAVTLNFPYGSPGTTGADWTRTNAHVTILRRPAAVRADFERTLDSDCYFASLRWNGKAALDPSAPHTFTLTPGRAEAGLEFVCAFAPKAPGDPLPNVDAVMEASRQHWPAFWNSGGAVDLSGSADPRWRELERRLVLSQYLMAIQAAGSLPPQESGLANNGWNGKFHLEMHWWHGTHFYLWNRWPLLERSLGWYRQILPVARRLAASQGYRGARWPKMVGPEGRDSPSGVGPLLIWQQPHPVYYASLDLRLHPGRPTLEKWRDVVFETAEFMASFAVLDKTSGRYALGPPLKTVPENTNPRAARNPSFELSYWRFGLRVAQQWREGLGLPRQAEWDEVLTRLAPLPTQDGVYLLEEGMSDTYTKWNWEHPSLVGPLGMLPGDGAAAAIMRPTVRKVWDTWQWERKNWGWDFPMAAMAAARCGEPGLAVEALLFDTPKNRFEANGFSSGGPYPYFPSNGGLLSAVAMMAAGWEGGPEGSAPGFPKDGRWQVRHEGLRRLP